MELQLVFRCTNGNKRILIVNNPREDVTLEEATTVMQLVIDKNIFNSAYGDRWKSWKHACTPANTLCCCNK